MSYATINQNSGDWAYQSRLTACIAQEQLARGEPVNPAELVYPMSWSVAAATDVESAYASALAAGNPDPGGDESVITDGMILSHVQARWPAALGQPLTAPPPEPRRAKPAPAKPVPAKRRSGRR